MVGECSGQPAEPGIIATKLKELYLTYAYEYGLHAQIESLPMQPGNYTTYADRFSELASQFRGMNPTHLMYMFLNGLTANYKQHVLLHGVTTLRTFRKLVAAWIWRHGLHSIPAHQRWPPSNVSADHSLGVSPRPVPVAPDLEQDLPRTESLF